MKYKLIATDLDGTLLNSDSKLGSRNSDAISKLTELCVNVVPATGRSYCEIPDEVKKCDKIRYLIYSNGSVVYDKVSGEKILFTIKKETAAELFRLLFAAEAHLTATHDGQTFADALDDEIIKYYSVDKTHAEVISQYAGFPDDFRSFVFSFEDVEVISAYFHSDAERRSCYEKIIANGELNAIFVGKFGLEIFHKSAGKGAALRALCDKLGVKRAETIGVGDSSNDLSLLNEAGIGLAVENAHGLLKSAADGVICSNDDGAMA